MNTQNPDPVVPSTTFTQPLPENAVRLDIGCGKAPKPGFIGVDRLLGGECVPLTINGKGFASNSVDEIYASHVLEHLGHSEARAALREWTRVLKPGGRIRIAVPDIDYIIHAYVNGDPLNVGGFLWGGQIDENDFHKTGFDAGLLTALLNHAGIENITRFKPEYEDCSKLRVSLNLEGRKAHRKMLDKLPIYPFEGVHMIQSMPRLAFTENMFSCLQVAVKLGIPFTKISGVNWGQCLERAIEAAIEAGAEWILTCDYDSIFTTDHVTTLWNLFHDSHSLRNDISAIAPIEFKREANTILAGVIDEKTGKRADEVTLGDLEKDLIPVEWAHFGLTFLRVQHIKRMKKPWFYEQPDANGSWHDGRIDNDIMFWRGLRESGGKVCIAPKVAIGHAQLLYVWPDQQMSPIYQYSTDYTATGVPKEARR